jgi:putative transposase
MIKTYQEKLYNNKKKNKYLYKQIELGCEIYNHCIALHKRYYRRYKKYLPLYSLQKHITKLKKQKKYSHWNKLNSQSIQDITERIDNGYKKFFRKENKRPPGFKKRKKYKSISLKQTGYKYTGGNIIKIGKKIYKFFRSRPIEGNIKKVTIKRDSLGDIYLSIVSEVNKEKENLQTGNAAGFDFGLKTFLTTSDEEEIKSLEPLKKSLKELQKAGKELSKKKKGSNNRKRARINLVRKHKKIRNQRKDFHFKLARDLTLKYDYLFFEDLSLSGMVKLWGRKVQDLGFNKFLTILEMYCNKYEKTLHCIDKFYPSSKTCHKCGYINKELNLKDRHWICPHCKAELQRDLNAAINIYKVGASTFGLDEVRLSIRKAFVV